MLVLILFLLSLGITLSLPPVQTKIGSYVTEKLNKTYKTDIKIEQVSITIFGGIKLKKVMIKDHHKDTLIYANRIKTNILSFKKLYNGDLYFGDIRIDGLLFSLKTYKGEKDTNINKFISLFDSGKPSTRPFLLDAKNAYLTNSHFRIMDENLKAPKNLDLTKIDASLSNFKIYGPDVTTKINLMSFKDHRGLNVENLSSVFTYTKKNILLKDLEIKTKHSFFNGNVGLYYNREDFVDFNNKVKFDVQIDESVLATNDIRYFYDELGKNQIFNIRSHIKGTLNNLIFTDLSLIDGKNQQIIGDVNFRNLLGNGDQQFYMKGNFSKVSANYKDLTNLLPNVLGKNLPSSMQKFGQFNLAGYAEITTSSIHADIIIKTILGNVKSNLVITDVNQIDNASYIGNITLEDFNVGSFLDRKDIGKVSLNFDVIGKGFTEKLLNTSASGKVSKFYYNRYNYSNIVVNGNFKAPIFKGKLNINDPNLLMDFEGLADISKKDNKYDFHAKIDYANLRKLNFIKDSISIFKGDINMNISGNSIDNLQGIVNINQTSYQNSKDNYIFDDFILTSYFDENRVRTITINSPDIIDGKVVGKFQFNQLQRMVENAAGSLYANYEPNKIKKGQFLKFNFSVYNKIIEIFYPGIEVGASTEIKGNINSDNDEFKLNFDSPYIKAFDNNFDKIKVNIDNKNPLYNVYIEMDSIKTKYYKISNFSLINVT
ncbi:MAG: translocation/assembly module TamB, partial [Flavobacterium sp.]|nr:translocation/assembly module TamB [Flavobacterium sp.]